MLVIRAFSLAVDFAIIDVLLSELWPNPLTGKVYKKTLWSQC